MRRRVIWLALIALAVAALAAAEPLTGKSWRDLADGAAREARALWDRQFAGQTETSKGAGGGKRDSAPPSVVTSLPVTRQVVDWDEYTGRFDAVETVEIKSRVGGYLTGVHFKDGQEVKAGDLLFVIDPRPFERARGLAEAELAQAKVKVANASLDVERARPLVGRRIISEKTFDDRANLMRDAEAAVKVNEERLKSAELELSFTRIMAPISGRMSRTIVTAGNLVSGGTEGATTLTTIVSQDPIYLYLDISENSALKQKRLTSGGLSGALVEIALPDEEGFPHHAAIDFVDNRLDGGTGTLTARARVENVSGLFSAGMFARVRVRGSPEYNALLLPDEAIATDQTSRFVWVAGDDGMPQRRAVTLGPLVDNLRVVREGIAATDWVVVKGTQRVRPGQRVAAKREPVAVSDVEAKGAPPRRTQ